MNINRKSLPIFFEQIGSKGAAVLSLTISTKKDLLKKGRETKGLQPFGFIKKVSTLNGLLNFNYQDSVNKARIKEEKNSDFTSQGNFFTPVFAGKKHKALVFHKETGSPYLKLKLQKVVSTTSLDPKGNIVDTQSIQEFLPKVVTPQKQSLDKPVVCLTIGLDSIVSVTYNEEVFTVCD